MKTFFSIIVCTYNPDRNIFNRLLSSLKNILVENTFGVQFIFVDNNSKHSIAEYEEIKKFAELRNNTLLISEKEPGLTQARLAGVNKAKYEWIIFFDDDNEPDVDYLQRAQELIDKYPEVGCWGPGSINVEFIGTASNFACSHRQLFQERKMNQTVVDNVRWEQNAYPYGTGMIVKKEVLSEYNKNVLLGNYSLTDRKGNSLISGGDTQILLTAIKLGYYAGSSPCLKLNHLIASKKTRYKEILRLAFSLSASAIKSYNEVFTDDPFPVTKIKNLYVLKTIYIQIRNGLFKKNLKEIFFDVYKRLGELQAHILASPVPQSPALLGLFYKMIK